MQLDAWSENVNYYDLSRENKIRGLCIHSPVNYVNPEN